MGQPKVDSGEGCVNKRKDVVCFSFAEMAQLGKLGFTHAVKNPALIPPSTIAESISG